MAPLRCALTLALLGALALGAAAADFPAFANGGGPPFLTGPSYQFDEAADVTTAMGYTNNDTYSFAYVKGGDLYTEVGRYTSWECGDEPGSYYATAEVYIVDLSGKVDSFTNKTVCEFGFMDSSGLNRWSQSEDACPTEAVNTNVYMPDELTNVDNVCGEPAPAPAADLAKELAEMEQELLGGA